MPTYAAIKLSRDTIGTILASVQDIPAGKERLTWAMLRYPYRSDVQHYYIGGNYLHLNQPDFTKQILTQAELDAFFEYKPQKLIAGRVKPEHTWFPVRLKEHRSADMVLG